MNISMDIPTLRHTHSLPSKGVVSYQIATLQTLFQVLSHDITYTLIRLRNRRFISQTQVMRLAINQTAALLQNMIVWSLFQN